MSKTLFLDYDGVLHPASVWLNHGEIQLDCEDESLFLFCWAPILESILDDEDPHGLISIVISSTWSHRYGWKAAAKRLTAGLQTRVKGGTTGYNQTRGRQIEMYVEDVRIPDFDWIALDDDDYKWPTRHLDKLIRTNPDLGLLEKSTQQFLRQKLKELLLR